MPYYNDLRPQSELEERDQLLVFPDLQRPAKQRTIENLLRLREGLRQEIVPRRAEQNLLVASWNIKEFGHTEQRLEESYFYIAEIIAAFDLVAIQEVKSSLRDLDILMRILGSNWRYIINDITEGRAGNSERSAYVFNTNRVQFAGLAGELIIWEDLQDPAAPIQLKRTPFMTGFRSGWKTFTLVNVHLHPGKQEDDVAFRRREVELLLRALDDKIRRSRLWNRNLVLLGDFNLYKKWDDPTVEVFESFGYREVESLKGKDTTAAKSEAYDRFFLNTHRYFRLAQNAQGQDNGGVFDLFTYIFRLGEETTYRNQMKAVYGGSKDLDVPANLKSYYNHYWRRNQISDHLPIWMEIITDSSDAFLTEKLRALEDEE